MIKIPTRDELLVFLEQTHTIEKVDITQKAITHATLRTPEANPYVVGHFDAFNYMFKELLKSPEFPVKDAKSFATLYASNETLIWLRDLHAKMTFPFVKARNIDAWKDLSLSPQDCGVYRTNEKLLAFSMAPSPNLLPKLLHNWLVDLGSFHLKIKDNLNQAYRPKNDVSAAEKMAYDANIFIAAVQPFEFECSRLGRLVENALRLAWHLPWKHVPTGADYRRYTTDLLKFESSDIFTLIKRASA